MLPILTRYLTPSEYSAIAIIQVIYSIALACYGSIQANVSKAFIYKAGDDFAKYLFSILTSISIVFLFLQCTLLPAYKLSESYFGIDSNYIVVMPFIAAWSMVNLVNLALLRIQEKPFEFAVWECSHALVNVLLSLLLVVYFRMDSEGRVYGIYAPMILFGALSLYRFFKLRIIASNSKLDDLKDIAKVSLPLIPHTLGAVIITTSDNLMIAALLGKDEVGLYSVGYQFGMVIMLLTDAFSKAWQPIFYRYSKDGMYNEIKKIQTAYLTGLPLIAIAYSIIAYNIVPFILGDDYESSIQFIPVVVSAYVAMGVYQLYFPYLILYKRTKILTIITPAAAILNVILNYVLLPEFGAIIAAYTTLICYLFTSISIFIYARKLTTSKL